MDDGQEQCFTVKGFRFRCTMWKQRDTSLAPCVVLPGLYQTAAQVNGLVVKHLLSHMTCIVIEPPGLMGTDSLPMEHGPEFLADAVRQVIGGYGLGPVSLVSISAGTPIGYLTALRFPECVLRSVFIGFVGRPAPRTDNETAISLLDAGRLADWADMVLGRLICQDPDRRVRGRAVITSLIRRRIMNGDRSDIEQMIHILRRNIRHRDWFPGVGLRQPALFFTGEHDTATPPASALQAAALCADARVTSVRESDHMVLLQRPAEVAELVVRHCSGGSLENLPYCHPVEYFGSATPEATSSSAPAPA